MELIHSIDSIFGRFSNNKIFHIPEYQRGYKWSSQQIRQLLDDIKNFETVESGDIFYCLQNITLVEKNGNLNVVDGQQRLTSIALLLAFLGEQDKVKQRIKYAIREESNEFLQTILENPESQITEITSSEDFDAFLNYNDRKNYDFQDIYYMYNAIKTINNWFQEKEKENERLEKKIFKEKLLHHVKLITNMVGDDEKEQELFMNLNAGQVHLDGSDLVRAILITRVAKEEMETFNNEEVQDIVRLQERRVRIGWELDEMNSWWSKPEIKIYFSYFTNMKADENETIDFNQDEYPVNLLYKLWVGKHYTEQKSAQSKSLSDRIKLEFFENNNISALELFQSIKELHRTLKDWYYHHELYHLLGFIFAQTSYKFQTVWEQWKSVESKSDFINSIKKIIMESVFSLNDKPDEDYAVSEQFDEWMDSIVNSNKNWYNEPSLGKILILLDVINHINKQITHLNPKYFRKQKEEDKEHIFPSTPREIEELNDVEAPIEKINEYIKILNHNLENITINGLDIEESDWSNLTLEQKTNQLIKLNEEIHSKTPINSIGNLVLLHMSINRGIGNNYYPHKRSVVIKNVEQGKYVRQHTLNVFVKQDQSEDLNTWSINDIKINENKIHDQFKSFFKEIEI
jgi:hypothetical protein